VQTIRFISPVWPRQIHKLYSTNLIYANSVSSNYSRPAQAYLHTTLSIESFSTVHGSQLFARQNTARSGRNYGFHQNEGLHQHLACASDPEYPYQESSVLLQEQRDDWVDGMPKLLRAIQTSRKRQEPLCSEKLS